MKNRQEKSYLSIVKYIQPVLAILIVLFISLVFINKGISDSSKYNYITSSFEKTTYDYIIYDPIEEQVNEVKEYDGVDKVFSFYEFKGSIENTQKKSSQTNIIFSNDNKNLDITSFTKDRLIAGKSELSDNEIFIDQETSKDLKIKIGDKVVLNVHGESLTLKVVGIFEDNSFYHSGDIKTSVYFKLNDDIKNKITSKKQLNLKGMYIKGTDHNTAFNSLKNYKPLGKMSPRDNFSSDREYETYKEKFLSIDYSGQIYDKNKTFNRVMNNNVNEVLLKKSEKNIFIIAILIVVTFSLLMIRSFYLNGHLDDLVSRFKVSINRSSLLFKLTFLNIVTIVISAAGFIFLINSSAKTNIVYNNYITKVYLSTIGSLVLAFVVMMLLDLLFVTKKTINNKKDNSESSNNNNNSNNNYNSGNNFNTRSNRFKTFKPMSQKEELEIRQELADTSKKLTKRIRKSKEIDLLKIQLVLLNKLEESGKINLQDIQLQKETLSKLKKLGD